MVKPCSKYIFFSSIKSFICLHKIQLFFHVEEENKFETAKKSIWNVIWSGFVEESWKIHFECVIWHLSISIEWCKRSIVWLKLLQYKYNVAQSNKIFSITILLRMTGVIKKCFHSMDYIIGQTKASIDTISPGAKISKEFYTRIMCVYLSSLDLSKSILSIDYVSETLLLSNILL